MKFLFVLDGVDYPNAANIQLCRNLATQLTQNGHGVEVLYLTGKATDCVSFPASIPAHLLLAPAEALMETILEHGASGGTPIPLRLMKLAFHPTAAIAAFRRIVLKRPQRVQRCAQMLETLCAQNTYDAVIAIAAPFTTVQALLNVNIPCKKSVWQMDPLGDNPSLQTGNAFALEQQILTKIHYLFTTDSARERYQSLYRQDDMRSELKIIPLKFPCFISSEATGATNLAPHSDINVVFCGSLYKSLRTPHFALELFCKLNRSDVVLKFIGGGWENYPPELTQKAQAILGNRLQIIGPVPPQVAHTAIEQADVLLNLGNANFNQIPSKIFEYFATLKPILTLAKNKQDPSLPLLNSYPLQLTLMESADITDKEVSALSDFLSASFGKTADHQTVTNCFIEYSPQYVAQTFVEAFLPPENP